MLTPPPSATAAKSRFWLVTLLFLVIAIAAIDRGSLSVAAPVLSRDYDLSPARLGLLLSAFFWSYALLQVVGGWLVDRFSAAWVLTGGVIVWSLATMSSGFTTTIGALFAFRLLLGAGEATLYPALSKAIASTFAPKDRGLPNALMDAGVKIGSALGLLLGGLLLARFGWRGLFFVLGGASLAWLLPWLLWNRRFGLPAAPVRQDRTKAETGPGVGKILARREFWGATIGSCSFGYAYFFLLTWLPTYLVRERHLSLEAMAIIGSAPYWVSAAVSVLGGWVSDTLIRRGKSPTMVRKSIVVSGLLLSTIALPSVFVADLGVSIGLMCLAYVALGIFGSNYWTISQTLAGPEAVGRWVGLQNALGGATGIIAPLVTGLIVQVTGNFQFAFVVAAVIAVIGAASYLFLVGAVEPLDWGRPREKHE